MIVNLHFLFHVQDHDLELKQKSLSIAISEKLYFVKTIFQVSMIVHLWGSKIIIRNIRSENDFTNL